ncbi:MAG TPA: DEAD/DEAH box helicase [Candidatus Magasanikbacteria bacterium]|nr:DEAD/DEAH box helicase [Candidatus Magasanikbacteria bacterium]
MHKYSIRRKKSDEQKFTEKKDDKNRFSNIEINDEFAEALDILENRRDHIFLTGKAGTGKSTLLEYWRAKTGQNIAVLAPTGVAALNVRGQTIHSFFGFRPGITPNMVRKHGQAGANSLYGKLDALVIDEISMVRADLLDCIDKFMRLNGKDPRKPFGGTRMIFLGDLYQLPPVVTDDEKDYFNDYYASPYFFSAKVLNDKRLLGDDFTFRILELNKIYRQKDGGFIKLLNRVRENLVEEEDLKLLNKRVDPNFVCPEDDFYIYLTATNALAAQINENRLRKLPDAERTFKGKMEGDFEDRVIPAENLLKLKVGAQVMLLNNDKESRWVNGTVGKVVDIGREIKGAKISVELDGGDIVEVLPYTWHNYKHFLDKGKNKVETEIVGTYTQYPLKLAWAVTIHKAQGKTFQKAILDIGWGTFAHGQLYVALSRCSNLSGLVLKQPLLKRHVITDPAVTDFLKNQ